MHSCTRAETTDVSMKGHRVNILAFWTASGPSLVPFQKMAIARTSKTLSSKQAVKQIWPVASRAPGSPEEQLVVSVPCQADLCYIKPMMNPELWWLSAVTPQSCRL